MFSRGLFFIICAPCRVWYFLLQCFDTAGWTTGRGASGL